MMKSASVVNARLQTDIIVSAVIRECSRKSIPIYVLNKGEAESGTIIVKVVLGINKCILFNQMRDIDGNIVWMQVFEDESCTETEVDSYIKRAIDRDPDVWVVEVEDSEGKNPFEGGAA